MPKRPRRPAEVSVSYRGIPFILDLVKCRRALVGCQIAGKFDRMEELAETIGISRSTVSRFFGGRPTSLIVTKKILAAMGLKFEDVFRPAEVLPRGNTGGKADGAVDDAA